MFLFPSPPTPPHTEPRAQQRRRARTGRPTAVREPLSVVPRPVSPDPKSSDGILCGCSIICSTAIIFAGASRRQSEIKAQSSGPQCVSPQSSCPRLPQPITTYLRPRCRAKKPSMSSAIRLSPHSMSSALPSRCRHANPPNQRLFSGPRHRASRS